MALLLALAVALSGCASGGGDSAPSRPKEPAGTILAIGQDFYSPANFSEGEAFEIPIEITNTGELPMQNVNVVFYNFGSNIDGCNSVFLGDLAAGEKKGAICSATAVPRSEWGDPSADRFVQEMSAKVSYSYALSGAYDSIQVMSADEFSRTNPTQKSATKEVSAGPVTLKAEFGKQPAASGKEFPITLSFTVRRSDTEGIEVVDGSAVSGAQVRIPETFSFSGKGGFDAAGISCGDGRHICASKAGWDIFAKNGSTLTINIKPPDISVPQETYSARFDADGFTVFKIAKKRITIVAGS